MAAKPTTTTPHNAATHAAPAEDVVIKCLGLSKIFKDFWMRSKVRAVDDVNLEVRRGEVFGLLGPNGSGKSTTIKMILGLLHPTAGRIAVFGKRPEDVATKKRIGYLPEESYLYPFLNARETLEYYSRLFHQSMDQRRRRIDMLLKMVGLDAVQRRPVREYSKGMQRRIGIAQALINDPDLLVLDEPTTGMDPIGTAQIKDLIKALARKGKTILLCSHLLADVEDVCDRVSIMYGGKVRAEGTVDELLTEQQMTTLQVPGIDDDTIREVDELLARRGKSIAKVEQPRQRLEKFFLDIVHRAQAEGAKTSGATSGGPIADFLVDEARSAHLPEGAEAAAIINKLTGGEEPPAPPRPQPLSKPAQAAASAPQAPAATPVDAAADDGADVSVIAALSGAAAVGASSVQAVQPPIGLSHEVSQGDEPAQAAGDVSVIEGLISGASVEEEADGLDEQARDEQAWRDLDMPVLDEKTVRRAETPRESHAPIRPEDLIAQLAHEEQVSADADVHHAESADVIGDPIAAAPSPIVAEAPPATAAAAPEVSTAKPAPPEPPRTDAGASPAPSKPPARQAVDPNDPSPTARLQRANAELLARLAKAGRKADAIEKATKPADEPDDHEAPDSAFKDVLEELDSSEEDSKK